MDNIDSIIFTKTFISELDKDGFFNETENPFMDSELLYDEILKHSTENLLKYDKPEITVEQFSDSVMSVHTTLIKETFNDMVDKGLLEPSGFDVDGKFLYTINEDVNELLEKIFKKNDQKLDY